MGTGKKIGNWVLVTGLILCVVSVTADYIPGSPVTNPNEFGQLQITGVVIGVISVMVGWALIRKA